MSLKDARERRDEARKLIANGIDPSAAPHDAGPTTWTRSMKVMEILLHDLGDNELAINDEAYLRQHLKAKSLNCCG